MVQRRAQDAMESTASRFRGVSVRCLALAWLCGTAVSAAEGQAYRRTMSNGTTVRIQGDTSWLERGTDFRPLREPPPGVDMDQLRGRTVRSILKGDRFEVTTTAADGKASTSIWRLAADSARLIERDGKSMVESNIAKPTVVVLAPWEIARLDRLVQTGVDGPTFGYKRP